MKSTSRTAPDTEAQPHWSPTCRTNWVSRGGVGFIAPGTPGNHWGHTRSSGLLRGFAVTGYITD